MAGEAEKIIPWTIYVMKMNSFVSLLLNQNGLELQNWIIRL